MEGRFSLHGFTTLSALTVVTLFADRTTFSVFEQSDYFACNSEYDVVELDQYRWFRLTVVKPRYPSNVK